MNIGTIIMLAVVWLVLIVLPILLLVFRKKMKPFWVNQKKLIPVHVVFLAVLVAALVLISKSGMFTESYRNLLDKYRTPFDLLENGHLYYQNALAFDAMLTEAVPYTHSGVLDEDGKWIVDGVVSSIYIDGDSVVSIVIGDTTILMPKGLLGVVPEKPVNFLAAQLSERGNNSYLPQYMSGNHVLEFFKSDIQSNEAHNYGFAIPFYKWEPYTITSSGDTKTIALNYNLPTTIIVEIKNGVVNRANQYGFVISSLDYKEIVKESNTAIEYLSFLQDQERNLRYNNRDNFQEYRFKALLSVGNAMLVVLLFLTCLFIKRIRRLSFLGFAIIWSPVLFLLMLALVS